MIHLVWIFQRIGMYYWLTYSSIIIEWRRGIEENIYRKVSKKTFPIEKSKKRAKEQFSTMSDYFSDRYNEDSDC